MVCDDVEFDVGALHFFITFIKFLEQDNLGILKIVFFGDKHRKEIICELIFCEKAKEKKF